MLARIGSRLAIAVLASLAPIVPSASASEIWLIAGVPVLNQDPQWHGIRADAADMWTADAPWTRPLPKPGRTLGHTRYDKIAQDLGAHGEFVEKPHDIRPALERAAASGKPAVVNVITDHKARAQTVRFSAYTT